MAENRQSINIDINGTDNSSTPLRNAANSLQGVETAAREASGALNSMDANAAEANAELQRMSTHSQSVATGFGGVSSSVGSAWSAIKGFIGAYVGIQSAEQVVGMSDDFKDLESKISLVTDSSTEFSQVMDGLNKISSDTGSAINDNAALYSRMAGTLKDAGKSTEDLLTLTDVVAKTLKVSGASTAEASSFTTQFAQAMGSGVLRGEEFNAMMESNIRFARALAQGLNVPIGSLRQMAEDGKLTADVIFDAVTPSLAALTAESESMGVKVSSSWVKIKNGLEQWIGQADKSSGVSEKLIGLMDELADSFTDGSSALNVISTAVGNFTSELGTAYDQLFKVNGIFGDFFKNLRAATIGVLDWANQLDGQNEAIVNLALNTEKLDAKLKQISQTTGINITSQDGFNTAVESGLVIFDQITQSWQNGAGYLERVSEQTGQAFTTQQQFNDAVANGTIVIDSANGVYKTAAVSLGDVANKNKEVASTQGGVSNATQTVAANTKNMGDTSKAVASSMVQDAANISSSYKAIVPSILSVVSALQQQQVAAQNAHEAANQANAAWENATDAAEAAQKAAERQDHFDRNRAPVSGPLTTVEPITKQLSAEGQSKFYSRINSYSQGDAINMSRTVNDGTFFTWYIKRAEAIAQEILNEEQSAMAVAGSRAAEAKRIADQNDLQKTFVNNRNNTRNNSQPNNANRSSGGGSVGTSFGGGNTNQAFLNPVNYGYTFSSGGSFVGQSGGDASVGTFGSTLESLFHLTAKQFASNGSSSFTQKNITDRGMGIPGLRVTFEGSRGGQVTADFGDRQEFENFLTFMEESRTMSISR
jgi:tape measure domain-containing protein